MNYFMKRLKLFWYNSINVFKEVISPCGDLSLDILMWVLEMVALLMAFFGLMILVSLIQESIIWVVILFVIWVLCYLGRFIQVYNNSIKNKDYEQPKVPHNVFKNSYKVLEDKYKWVGYYDEGFFVSKKIGRIEIFYGDTEILLSYRDFFKVYREAKYQLVDMLLEEREKEKLEKANKKKQHKTQNKESVEKLLNEMINDITSLKENLK